MSLTATTVSAALVGGETNTFGAVPVTEAVSHTTASNAAALSAGSGSGQAQCIVSFTATVNNTGTTYDLTALVGGLNGANRNFTAIKGIVVENTDATNSLIVGNAASNQFGGITSGATSVTTLEPGGFVASYSPASGFTTSSKNNLLIKSNTSTCACKVTVVGVGA